MPQGSVLGPLTLHSQHSHSSIGDSCSYHLYAVRRRSAALYIKFSCKPEEIIRCVCLVNKILADIVLWSTKQGLKLNLNKSQANACWLGDRARICKASFFSGSKSIVLYSVTLDYCDKV